LNNTWLNYSDLQIEILGPSVILDLTGSWFAQFNYLGELGSHSTPPCQILTQRANAQLSYWWFYQCSQPV